MLEASQVGDPWVRRLGAKLEAIVSADSTAKEIDMDGTPCLAMAVDAGVRTGSAIYTVMVAPVSDFTGHLKDILWASLWITLGVVFLETILAVYASREFSKSLQRVASDAQRAEKLDFSEGEPYDSRISEVHVLIDSIRLMRATIRDYMQDILDTQRKLTTLVEKGIALSAENNLDKLLELIFLAASDMTQAESGILYLKRGKELQMEIVRSGPDNLLLGGVSGRKARLGSLGIEPAPDGVGHKENGALACLRRGETLTVGDPVTDGELEVTDIGAIDPGASTHAHSVAYVPIKNSQGEVLGVMQLMNPLDPKTAQIVPFGAKLLGFIESLASQAGVSLDNRNLLQAVRELLNAFIKLIAGAIDAKSPYTGGHCSRVPVLATMLAEAAMRESEGPFATFAFTEEEQWQEFQVAAWLHDCGKVTTPEYVVDKATKLETIYNRVHEIRMRFEVLLRDATIAYYQGLAESGADEAALRRTLEAAHDKIKEDFAFVANCNVGGEFLSDAAMERLRAIGSQTWMRHLDNRLGMSSDELRRMKGDGPALPTPEPLLADKPEHVIAREGRHPFAGNDYGFAVEVPENLYNLGELYNLCVRRGTLTPEERFKINEHTIQTIIMLNKLPFPKGMRNVPEYAGAHHETMIGTGYPRRLHRGDMSLPARIMAIADIFEALTASDRPYKSAKPISAALKIMSFMRNDQHIDAELFDLFLRSGVWKDYAREYLASEQNDIDDVSPFYAKN